MALYPDSTTRAGADRSDAVPGTASSRSQRQTMTTEVAPSAPSVTRSVIGSPETEALNQFRRQRDRSTFRTLSDSLTVAPGFGNQADAFRQAGAPTTATQVVAAEEQLAEELIEEREEVLEESGGSSDETEELGDDPKEEIQEVKNSLRVLYSFNPTYTSYGYIESLNPDFRRIQGSRARKERAQAKLAARDSVLIAKVELKSGRVRLDDYKSMSRIDEPVLDLEQRKFIYKPGEKSKLRIILSRQPFDTTSITDKINSFLEVPEFERIEAPIIINKFEIENEFRLSPIEDSPTQIEVQSDSRTPPRIGSFLRKIEPDRSTFRGTRRADDAFASRERPQVDRTPLGGGGTGGGTRGDIDTGLIRDLDRDRQFRQQDFGAASDLEFDELETGGPPVGGNYGGGPRGY